ncbi:MAG: tRNA uridine-5-carboxymethylaminomethyl(34) synthesis GTPase MnmE [Pseudomonadota bacterium]
MDTIYAVSTASGRAGIAVIRVSGPQAFDAVRKIAGSVPLPRHASLRDLKAADGSLIDKALVLCFEKGKSFTGENVAEFHCHGSPAVVQALLFSLSELDELAPAEPGEFTRRALENYQLDLSQVEGLADLLEAETESQRKQAMRVFAGELSRRVEGWRRDLIRAIALLEATIDFADEEVPEDVTPEVTDIVDRVLVKLGKELSGFAVSERIRSGFEVAIVGAPNVGKSTLLNALAGRDAAITSSLAGTTRDVIEVRMDLKGVPITLLDTAGMRSPADEIEKLGIARAKERAERADLRIFLSLPGEAPDISLRSEDIVLIGKSDVNMGYPDSVSGLTGEGIPELLDRLTVYFEERVPEAGLAIRDRHKRSIEEASQQLEAAQSFLLDSRKDVEIIAEYVRRAVISLDSIVGRFDIEAVLDEIFSSFCLGK